MQKKAPHGAGLPFTRVPLRARLHAEVVVHAAHAFHAAGHFGGALDLVLGVDEAVQLHHAAVAVDVDVGCRAEAFVLGKRGLDLGGQRRVAGELPGGAALARIGLLVVRGTATQREAGGEGCCCKKLEFHGAVSFLSGPMETSNSRARATWRSDDSVWLESSAMAAATC